MKLPYPTLPYSGIAAVCRNFLLWMVQTFNRNCDWAAHHFGGREDGDLDIDLGSYRVRVLRRTAMA